MWRRDERSAAQLQDASATAGYSRRTFLEVSALSISALGLAGCGADPRGAHANEHLHDRTAHDSDRAYKLGPSHADTTAECELTSDDILGPFYREQAPFRTALAGPEEPGRPLVIRGYVYGVDCTTKLSSTLIDVWQADDEGRYDNTSTEFKLRGRMLSRFDGYYEFASVLPGRYLNGPTYRPRHIHFKVSYAPNPEESVELVTQLYFRGDPYLATDPWAEPSRTIPLADKGNVLVGRFDITLPA